MKDGGRCGLLYVVLGVVLLADVTTMVYAVLNGPFPVAVAYGAPTAYLNIFVHVPLAVTSYIVFGVALVAALLYLWRRDDWFDGLAYKAVVVGEIYAFFTIVTGMAWASESWGAAWNWDPRETGVLLLLLAYLGYFALRSSIPDPERKRLVSNAYAVAAFSMVPLSYAAPLIFHSLHPSFREAQSFMWTGSTAALMGSRMLLAVATGVLLVLATYQASRRGCNSKPILAIGALVLVIGAAGALYVAQPYLAGDPLRVIDAGVENGKITWILLSDGRNVTFNPPVESPIKPAITGDGRPTIIGHMVLVTGDGLVVARHWCVPFNMAMYSLMVLAGLVASLRLSPPGPESGG